MNPRNLLILVLRVVLAGIFLYAAHDKILHPEAFSQTVENYHLLPRELVNVFALWLPMAELVVALALLAGLWTRASAAVLTAMMVMFLIAIVQGVARGINTHCGCFTQGGEATTPISVFTILRDLGFLALAALAWRLEREIPTWRLFRRS